MGLIEQARKDVRQFISNPDEFGVEVNFLAPTSELVTINCTAMKHSTGIGTDGLPVRSKIAHLNVSELQLTEQSYPTRNAAGLVHFAGHIVTWKDSTGILQKYNVNEWFPDETLGTIVLLLEDME